MKKSPESAVDINEPATWVPFRRKLCADCHAGCCSLPVEVRTEDLVRMELIHPFDAAEEPKKIAKRLMKEGIVAHFNFKHALFTLSRRANDDCIYIDSHSRRCTIYEKRPQTCRNHPGVGPRSGYCAYRRKKER